MADAVFGRKINVRLFENSLGDVVIHLGRGFVSEKNGAGLGIEGLNMADTVVFLIRPGQLMFLNDAALVIFAARDGHEAGLRMAAHDLAIKIKIGLVILYERALGDEFLEIFFAFGIDGRRVNVGAGRQIDFRFADMEKAQGISGGHRARFTGRDNVVGQFADLRSQFGIRAEGGKWFNDSHKIKDAPKRKRVSLGRAGVPNGHDIGRPLTANVIVGQDGVGLFGHFRTRENQGWRIESVKSNANIFGFGITDHLH